MRTDMTQQVPFDVILHLDPAPDQEMQARMHASDAEALGIDEYLVEDEWTLKAPFPQVVAHLLMFDPKWLFSQPWMVGWEARPTEEDE